MEMTASINRDGVALTFWDFKSKRKVQMILNWDEVKKQKTLAQLLNLLEAKVTVLKELEKEGILID